MFATLLSQSGVHPRVAQELMRHRYIRQTMEIYTGTSPFALAEGLGKLARLLARSRLGKEFATHLGLSVVPKSG
jgi:integrase